MNVKRAFYPLIFATVLVGCTAKPYQQTAVDKETQLGFNHNQAQDIIETNAKNRAKNRRANERAKEELNDQLNALNKNNEKTSTSKKRTFNFY